MNDTTTLWIGLLAGLAAVVAIVAFASSRQSRTRRLSLRQRFGPEYDRALALYGSPARADRELAARAQRVTRFRLRQLDDRTCAGFSARWGTIQGRFVDDPAAAVREAHALIKEVMAAIGYPADDFEQRTADLSVDHPNVVQHYRAAHALSVNSGNAPADTEELRQAVVHYRALFAELIERKPGPVDRTLRELHA